MPVFTSVSALRAATIGGTCVGLYGSQSMTELDCHANMAVVDRLHNQCKGWPFCFLSDFISAD